MNIRGIFNLIIIFIVLLTNEKIYSQRSKQNYEILQLIRQEKFNLILPGAMRDSGVDMWIHVVQGGIRDPLALDLGGQISFGVNDTVGYYIFTDRGDERIERVILGGYGDGGFISTNSLKLFQKIRRMRFYGIELYNKNVFFQRRPHESPMCRKAHRRRGAAVRS